MHALPGGIHACSTDTERQKYTHKTPMGGGGGDELRVG